MLNDRTAVLGPCGPVGRTRMRKGRTSLACAGPPLLFPAHPTPSQSSPTGVRASPGGPSGTGLHISQECFHRLSGGLATSLAALLLASYYCSCSLFPARSSPFAVSTFALRVGLSFPACFPVPFHFLLFSVPPLLTFAPLLFSTLVHFYPLYFPKFFFFFSDALVPRFPFGLRSLLSDSCSSTCAFSSFPALLSLFPGSSRFCPSFPFVPLTFPV